MRRAPLRTDQGPLNPQCRAFVTKRAFRPAMPRTVSLGTSRTVHRSIPHEDAPPRTRPASREMPAVRCLADGGRPERGLAVDPSPHLSMSKVPCPSGIFRRRGWKARSGYGGERSESVVHTRSLTVSSYDYCPSRDRAQASGRFARVLAGPLCGG
jgi:hypothetical protein